MRDFDPLKDMIVAIVYLPRLAREKVLRFMTFGFLSALNLSRVYHEEVSFDFVEVLQGHSLVFFLPGAGVGPITADWDDPKDPQEPAIPPEVRDPFELK